MPVIYANHLTEYDRGPGDVIVQMCWSEDIWAAKSENVPSAT